jgi:V/A-type H+-transporting ATPase subunit D
MAKIKHTKTELKAQTDALKRFQRFLPMLQLKKQQLQAELAIIAAHVEEVHVREAEARKELDAWVHLFSDDGAQLDRLNVTFNGVEMSSSNVAGVTIPVFKGIKTAIAELDLYATPAWLDDAADMIVGILSFRAERLVLQRQAELIGHELSTTSQRVNLFEKIKIPECREHIRVIKIAIGDEQTASITRGKIAKSRTRHVDHEENAA